MIKSSVRLFGTLWGWLVIAVVVGGVGLVMIDAQERYRTDLDLRVWHGEKVEDAVPAPSASGNH